MPHEKLKTARKKLKRRRQRKSAKRRASARRVRRGEPDGLREKAAVTKQEASKLKDELVKSAPTVPGGSSTSRSESARDSSGGATLFGPSGGGGAERLFGRDTAEGDSPLFKEQNVDDDPLFGAPASGGDTERIDMGFGAQQLDSEGNGDIDPLFGSGGSTEDRSGDDDLFQI